MRSFLISLLIGTVLIAGSEIYFWRMAKVSEELASQNEAVVQCLEKGDTEQAGRELERLISMVNEKRGLLEAMGEHGSIDKIETYAAEAGQYADMGESADALAKCRSLDILITHMPKNYRLCWENIL